VIADLRGDVEWTADGCDAAVFAAGARHRPELGAVDGGGAAKLAEAADRFELRRFVLCSAVGAGRPDRRQGPLREFLEAKHHAERRLARLDMPWTILRFGRLTDEPGTGRVHVQAEPFRGEVPRDDVAALLAAVLAEPRAAGTTLYVNGGDDPVDAALAGALSPS